MLQVQIGSKRKSGAAIGVALALALAIAVASPPAQAGLDTLPARERSLDAPLPDAPARDGVPATFGSATGEFCTLAVENFRLQRISTGTGHPTPEEATVYGLRRVIDFRAAQADDAQISVALLVEGSPHGYDAVVLSSDDLCATWSAPSTAIGSGDPGHPVFGIAAFERNALGVLALLTTEALTRDPFLTVSSDGGSTWQDPLSIRAAGPGAPGELEIESASDLAVDPAGSICLGYLQRFASGLQRIYTARSDDGGRTLAESDEVGAADRAIAGFRFVDQPAEGRLLLFRADEPSISPTSGEIRIDSTGSGSGVPWCSSWILGLTVAVPERPFGSPTVAKSRANDDHVMMAQTLLEGSVAVTSTASAGMFWLAPTVVAAETNGILSAARTDAGSWVLAWETIANDPDARHRSDIRAVVSTDDGATFGAPVAIDDTAPGAVRDALGRIAAGDGDVVALSYLSGTDGGRATDLFQQRAAAATALGAGPDPRVDGDALGAEVTVAVDPHVAIAGDAAGHTWVAFTAIDAGPHPDLFVTRSVDGGYTFEPPVRIGHGAPGAFVHRDPAIAVEGDNVVVGFGWYENGTELLHMAWRASNDLGATWPHERDLGSFDWTGSVLPDIKPSNYEPDVPSLSVAADAGGLVYAAYSDGQDVAFAASSDGGASLFVLNLDMDQTTAPARAVDFCVAGGDPVLAYSAGGELYAQISGNEGANWDPRVLMTPPGDFPSTAPEVSCGTSSAIVTYGLSAGEFGWRAHDGTTWLPDDSLTPAGGAVPFYTDAGFADGSTIVAAFDAFAGAASAVYVAVSTDGGATFGVPQRLDSVVPDATSGGPVVARTPTSPPEWHVYWSDDGEGSVFEPVVSTSTDGGLTWSDPARVGQGSAGEGVLLSAIARPRNAATVGSATMLAWWAHRDSLTGDVLVNAVDPADPDRDGALGAADCGPLDPDTYPGAPEIADGLDNSCPGDPGFGAIDEIGASGRVDGTGVFAWSPMPGADSYEIVRSDSPLMDTGCVSAVGAEPAFIDGTTPVAGEVLFYLARVFSPFAGSFGNASDGAPRAVGCAGS